LFEKRKRCSIAIAFKFGLENTIKKVQENYEELKLNGEQWLLIYGDGVNLLGDKYKYHEEIQRSSQIIQEEKQRDPLKMQQNLNILE
jgi:hypothetical protein